MKTKKLARIVLLCLSTFCWNYFVVTPVDAGVLDSFFSPESLLEKYKPFLTKFPRALPLFNGKIKSKKCRKQGNAVAEAAAELGLKLKEGALDSSMKTMQVVCRLEKDCLLEYIEAAKPLLETEAVKTIMQGVDPQGLAMFAGPAYDWLCSTKRKEEL